MAGSTGRSDNKDPESVANALSSYKTIAQLIDRSHITVTLISCPDCDQRWASIWTEIVDWSGGDDFMSTVILPLTHREADELTVIAEQLNTGWIKQVSDGRRYLCMFYSTAENKEKAEWSDGPLFIDPACL